MEKYNFPIGQVLGMFEQVRYSTINPTLPSCETFTERCSQIKNIRIRDDQIFFSNVMTGKKFHIISTI